MLTSARVLAASRVLLITWIILVLSIPFALPNMQVARDFAAFWTAAVLASNDLAAQAYGAGGVAALVHLFGAAKFPPFFYPPTALLIWLPFAGWSFPVAAGLWVALSLCLYALALRAMQPDVSLLPAFAFPAVLFCALYGQNALLTAALFAGAAALLAEAPVLAGMLLGVLIYKPQLAVLVPLVLAASGRWRAFFTTAATAAALIGLSVLIFGTDAWRGFWQVLPVAQRWNASGVPGFQTFVSPYAALRLIGASPAIGWAAQAMMTVIAVICTVIVIPRRPGPQAEIAMLCVATLFCVPFLGQYELVIGMVPAMWLAGEAIRTVWLPYERAALALLFVSPLAILVAGSKGIPLGPFALMALLALVTRRALHHTAPRE